MFEGPSTDACRECGFSAISASAQAQYVAALGSLSCSEAECEADCIASHLQPFVCVDNPCEIGSPFNRFNGLPCNGAIGFCLAIEPPDVAECLALPAACDGCTDCACLAGADAPDGVDLEVCLQQGSCEHNGLGFEAACPDG